MSKKYYSQTKINDCETIDGDTATAVGDVAANGDGSATGCYEFPTNTWNSIGSVVTTDSLTVPPTTLTVTRSNCVPAAKILARDA